MVNPRQSKLPPKQARAKANPYKSKPTPKQTFRIGIVMLSFFLIPDSKLTDADCSCDA